LNCCFLFLFYFIVLAWDVNSVGRHNNYFLSFWIFINTRGKQFGHLMFLKQSFFLLENNIRWLPHALWATTLFLWEESIGWLNILIHWDLRGKCLVEKNIEWSFDILPFWEKSIGHICVHVVMWVHACVYRGGWGKCDFVYMHPFMLNY
jgi:hypothetical protein